MTGPQDAEAVPEPVQGPVGPSAEQQEGSARFERLYDSAHRGEATVPWDRPDASALLRDWVDRERVFGAGRSAVVVGAGYGRDAELVARRGYDTTAFDVSPTAVAAATERHAGSDVRYVVADVFALPSAWVGAFDLVVESTTVQSLPPGVRPDATCAIASLVAPGGTLLVLSVAREDDATLDGPPWPLTRGEMTAFATDGLELVDLEHLQDEGDPTLWRWRGTFARG